MAKTICKSMPTLDYRSKAILVHHMLFGPTADVKDLFKHTLGNVTRSMTVDFMSEASYNIWKDQYPKDMLVGKAKFKHHDGFIIEHVVPVEVLYNWLLENKQRLSVLDIEHALKNCPICIITKEEDKLLNSHNLRESMPDDKYDVLAGNPFSRYDAAGIVVHQW